MTTKSKKVRNGVADQIGVAPTRVKVKGKRMVMLEEGEFERLLQKADEWEPPDPDLLPSGNYTARETLAVIQARNILRARRRLGLTEPGARSRFQ